MLTHESVWDAVDALASRSGWSVSGLAVRARLDPTALNRSKRIGIDGKPRWPSMETIAKLLSAAGMSLSAWCDLVEKKAAGAGARAGTVLCIDDDPAFRDFSACTLRAAGYTVHAVADHRAALDIVADNPDLDLLCADLVMPDGLGGIAVARLARQRRPGLKILYVTGYDLPGVDTGRDSTVLHKPVGPHALLAAVGGLVASRNLPS